MVIGFNSKQRLRGRFSWQHNGLSWICPSRRKTRRKGGGGARVRGAWGDRVYGRWLGWVFVYVNKGAGGCFLGLFAQNRRVVGGGDVSCSNQGCFFPSFPANMAAVVLSCLWSTNRRLSWAVFSSHTGAKERWWRVGAHVEQEQWRNGGDGDGFTSVIRDCLGFFFARQCQEQDKGGEARVQKIELGYVAVFLVFFSTV